MMQHIAGWLLTTVLSVVYLVIVTPLAWLCRLLGKPPLPWRGSPSSKSYWVETLIDTADPRTFSDGAVDTGARRSSREWGPVLGAYRSIAAQTAWPWKWWVLASLLPWSRLAQPPQEAEISAELYVLF